MNSCPLCGRELYLEESTGDPVCLACCKTNKGDHYTLLSLINSWESEGGQ